MNCYHQGCNRESSTTFCAEHVEKERPQMDVNGPAAILMMMQAAELKRTPDCMAAFEAYELLPDQKQVEAILLQTCIYMDLWNDCPGLKWHHILDLTKGLSNGDLFRLYHWPRVWPNVKAEGW